MAFPNRSVGFTSGLLQFSNVQADCYNRTSHLFKYLRVRELKNELHNKCTQLTALYSVFYCK